MAMNRGLGFGIGDWGLANPHKMVKPAPFVLGGTRKRSRGVRSQQRTPNPASSFPGGFTLTEAIMVVAILGILGTGSAKLLTGIIKTINFNQAQSAIQKDARNSISLMNRFMRQGYYTSVTVDSVASTDPPFSRIKFKVKELTTSTPEWHRFYQSGNKLYHGTTADNSGTDSTFTDSPLSSNLKTLAFGLPRTDDFTIISVSAAFEKGAGVGVRAFQMSVEKVRMMNAE